MCRLARFETSRFWDSNKENIPMSVFPKPEPPVIEISAKSASKLQAQAATFKPAAPIAAKSRMKKKARVTANRAT